MQDVMNVLIEICLSPWQGITVGWLRPVIAIINIIIFIALMNGLNSVFGANVMNMFRVVLSSMLSIVILVFTIVAAQLWLTSLSAALSSTTWAFIAVGVVSLVIITPLIMLIHNGNYMGSFGAFALSLLISWALVSLATVTINSGFTAGSFFKNDKTKRESEVYNIK